MHKAVTEKQSIWKLTYWIKKKSYLFSESFIIFSLYEQTDSTELCCCSQTATDVRVRSNSELAHEQVIISNEFNFKLAHKQVTASNESNSELSHDQVEFLYCFETTS